MRLNAIRSLARVTLVHVVVVREDAGHDKFRGSAGAGVVPSSALAGAANNNIVRTISAATNFMSQLSSGRDRSGIPHRIRSTATRRRERHCPHLCPLSL